MFFAMQLFFTRAPITSLQKKEPIELYISTLMAIGTSCEPPFSHLSFNRGLYRRNLISCGFEYDKLKSVNLSIGGRQQCHNLFQVQASEMNTQQ